MPKRIVICSDGTWNKPTQKASGKFCPTNVFKIKQTVAPVGKDGVPQIVFYDEGIGARGIMMSRLMRGATGLGLKKNIEDAYRFLMDNYAVGDAIYFLGFSRGAYTVRSTAGFLRKCGLLKREHADQFENAYNFYRERGEDSKPSSPKAQEFRRKYSMLFGDGTTDLKIKFIGVWDTVGALGIPLFLFGFINKWLGLEFHDLQLSSRVENAFHALAIDEFRNPFKPALFHQQEGVDGQRVEQVWFPGAHSNVGGGYADSGISDLALLWMIARAEECGLEFDPHVLATLELKPDPKRKIVNSRTPLYWVSRKYIRPIGAEKNTHESVAPEVMERYRVKNFYQPKNLLQYFSRTRANGLPRFPYEG
jgi:uncharacterized protein (DUF2235 family)